MTNESRLEMLTTLENIGQALAEGLFVETLVGPRWYLIHSIRFDGDHLSVEYLANGWAPLGEYHILAKPSSSSKQ